MNPKPDFHSENPSPHSTPNVRIFSSEEFALLVARPEMRLFFICVTMTVVGLIRGFRDHWPTSSLTMAIGGVFAVAGMLALGRSLLRATGPGPGGFLAIGGFLTYAYGLYLFGYEGVWAARRLVGDFSAPGLIAALAFAYFGYRVVYWIWRMSEIAEARRTGRIVLSD